MNHLRCEFFHAWLCLRRRRHEGVLIMNGVVAGVQDRPSPEAPMETEQPSLSAELLFVGIGQPSSDFISQSRFRHQCPDFRPAHPRCHSFGS